MLYNDFITCHNTAVKTLELYKNSTINKDTDIICYGHIYLINQDVCNFIIGEREHTSNITINKSCIIVSNYFKEELNNLHIIDTDKIVSVEYVFVHKN